MNIDTFCRSSPLCFLKLNTGSKIVRETVIYKVRTHVYKNANKFCVYLLERDGCSCQFLDCINLS